MAAMPSSCRIFAYKDVTSAVTKRALNERGESISIRIRKCFVFLMCDGKLLPRSWIKW